GDGSSMYSIQALWTAAELRLPMTIVIINNGRYAALKEFAPTFGFKPDETLQRTDLPKLDFVSLAKDHGLEGVRVGRAADLASTLKEAIASPKPVLVEVVVS